MSLHNMYIFPFHIIYKGSRSAGRGDRRRRDGAGARHLVHVGDAVLVVVFLVVVLARLQEQLEVLVDVGQARDHLVPAADSKGFRGLEGGSCQQQPMRNENERKDLTAIATGKDPPKKLKENKKSIRRIGSDSTHSSSLFNPPESKSIQGGRHVRTES